MGRRRVQGEIEFVRRRRRGPGGDWDQGFFDDVVRRYHRSEESASERGDRPAALLWWSGGARDHGRTGTDVQQIRIPAALLQSADEHGYVGALPAAIHVQLVEDEELKR